MSETSGFFNAERLIDGSYDRVYLAESFAQYFASFISDGVFGGSMGALQVVLQGNYGIAVQTGQGYIKGYWYQNDSNRQFELPPSSNTARVDSVVLRLDLTLRTISLAYIAGTPSVSPVPAALTRDEMIWELRLCNINVAANATTINASNIIDTRFDTNECGFVHGVVDQLDTTEYGNRLNGFIDNYIANVTVDYQNNFLTPLADKAAEANAKLDIFKSDIDTLSNDANGHYANFVTSLNSLIQLATEAYNDFLDWIAQNKVSALAQVQHLIDQLEALLIEGGDVSTLIIRMKALEAMMPTELIAEINHGFAMYPIVDVYEFQGGQISADGVITGATLTTVESSCEYPDVNHVFIRVKPGYGTVNTVTVITSNVYVVDFQDTLWKLCIKLGQIESDVSQIRNIINNIALTAETGTSTDTATPAVANAPVTVVLQTIWGKIRSLVNAIASKANTNHATTATTHGVANGTTFGHVRYPSAATGAYNAAWRYEYVNSGGTHDLNNYRTGGIYTLYSGSATTHTNYPAEITSGHNNNAVVLIVYPFYSNTAVKQILMHRTSTQRWERSLIASSWTAWERTDREGILESVSTDNIQSQIDRLIEWLGPAAYWTQHASIPNTKITAACEGNGTFVAVASNGTIRTSTDGITWTLRTTVCPVFYLIF